MNNQDQKQNTRQPSRRLSRRWRNILLIALIVLLVLGGVLYSQRHQIHQVLQALGIGVPPVQPVSITPLALSPNATGAGQVSSADWTMYHYDAARGGFVANAPDPASLANLWKRSLDGAVYAEPLVIDRQVIVATESNTLYSLDARSGQVQWHTTIGNPVPLSDLPCGDIDPLGITGTPVYDPHTGLVFAVAEVRGPAHILVGVDLKTGQVKVRRIIDPPGANPQVHQQRAALALSGNRVYIAFGGLYGDCGDYHGMVVASRTDGSGALLTYQVPTQREAGIWATPGPVIDAQGNLYVTVGNGAATGGDWDHSDSVLRLSPTLQLEDAFAPQSWANDNAADLDLGSLGLVLLPNGLLFIQGKSNQGYLLRADHLGGIGGQIQSISACSGGAYGGAAVSGQMAFIPCADGLRQIKLNGATSITTGWQAPSQVTGSPIVGGNTVYSLAPGAGTLYALDAATGSTRATISVGQTSRFATPALAHNTLFIGTMSGIVAVAIQ